MTRFVVIDDQNQIVNMIEAEPGFEIEEHTLVAHDRADQSWTFDGVSLQPPPGPPLDEVRAAYLDAVERAAERRRVELSSQHTGKRDVYNRKGLLARESLNDASLLDKFSEEAAKKGITTEQLRDAILIKADQLDAWQDAIEAEEDGGKAAVAAAGDEQTLNAARDAALAALGAIGA